MVAARLCSNTLLSAASFATKKSASKMISWNFTMGGSFTSIVRLWKKKKFRQNFSGGKSCSSFSGVL